MKKKKRSPGPLEKFLGSPFLNFYWGGLAVLAWGGVQVWHAQRGIPFSPLLFLKGFFLLGLATVAYQFSLFAKGPSFLGLYPLLWLSVSRFQWNLCAADDLRPWLWLVLFLVSEIVLFKIADGKKLLLALAPLWTGMILVSFVSILMPISFVRISSTRFKNASWVRWGGLALALGLSLVFKFWIRFNLFFLIWWTEVYKELLLCLGFWFLIFYFPVVWSKKAFPRLLKNRLFQLYRSLVLYMPLFILAVFFAGGDISQAPLYDLLITKLYISFLLLGWLGWAIFPEKGNFRTGFIQFLLLALGFLLWVGSPPQNQETAFLSWALVWVAGFGWEAVRRDLMDPSWHGRLLWAVLGILFFEGVI